MGGILAGAAYGLGQAGQAIGMEALKNQLEEEKAARLAELQGDITRRNNADSQTRAGEIERQNREHAAELAGRDAKSVATELQRPVSRPGFDNPGMTGTMDEQDVPRTNVIDASAKRGYQIAASRGLLDTAKRYQELDNNDLTESEKIDRQGRAAQELKRTEGTPSETKRNNAYAAYMESHATNEADRPRQENQRASRLDRKEQETNQRIAGNNFLTIGDKLMDNVRDERAKMQKEFELTGVPKEGRALAEYHTRKAKLDADEKRAADFIEQGRSMLSSGGSRGNSQAPGDVYAREPILVDKPPRDGLTENKDGFLGRTVDGKFQPLVEPGSMRPVKLRGSNTEGQPQDKPKPRGLLQSDSLSIAPTAPASQNMEFSQFIKRSGPKSMTYVVDAPSGLMSSLKGRTFSTMQEANQAIASLYNN